MPFIRKPSQHVCEAKLSLPTPGKHNHRPDVDEKVTKESERLYAIEAEKILALAQSQLDLAEDQKRHMEEQRELQAGEKQSYLCQWLTDPILHSHRGEPRRKR